MAADLLSCPNCGGSVPRHIRASKVVVCPQCRTTLIFDDKVLRSGMTQPVLSDMPSLFNLHGRAHYRGVEYAMVGRLRYEYGDGRGQWDEWYCYTDQGETVWISVDEGDIVIEHPLGRNSFWYQVKREQLKVGNEISYKRQKWLVTEVNKAKCIAAEGEFPEEMPVGHSMDYVDVLGPKRGAITVEFDDDNTRSCYQGVWVDPFDVKPVDY